MLSGFITADKGLITFNACEFVINSLLKPAICFMFQQQPLYVTLKTSEAD